MKLILAAIIIASSSIIVFAQTEKPTPKMPMSEITNLITYTSVVKVDSLNKMQLYERALNWFKSYYNNPTDVIRENNAQAGKIVGKARYKVYTPEDKKGAKADMGPVQYTITFEARDERYKVELTEFNWKQISYYPIEKWMDKNDAGYRPNYDYYLFQTDEFAKQLMADLEKAMNTIPIADDRDKW